MARLILLIMTDLVSRRVFRFGNFGCLVDNQKINITVLVPGKKHLSRASGQPLISTLLVLVPTAQDQSPLGH